MKAKKNLTPSQLIKVLIVEDDSEISEAIEFEVSNFFNVEFEIVKAFDGVEGMLHSSLDKFDVIITDFNMPGLNGLALLKEVRATDCINNKTPVMLLSAMRPDLKGSLNMFEEVYFMDKPWTAKKFEFILNCCLKEHKDVA